MYFVLNFKGLGRTTTDDKYRCIECLNMSLRQTLDRKPKFIIRKLIRYMSDWLRSAQDFKKQQQHGF